MSNKTLKDGAHKSITSGKAFIEELYQRAGVLGTYSNNNSVRLGLKGASTVDLIKYNSGWGNLKNKEVTGTDANGNPIILYTGKTAKYTQVSNTSSIMTKYLYSNFYGLSLTSNKNDLVDDGVKVKDSLAWNFLPTSELKDRARFIKPKMLETGDIILVQSKNNPDSDAAYIYIDDSLWRYKYTENDNNVTMTIEKIKDTSTNKELTKFLNDLMGKNYIIFRPYV